MGYDDFQYIPLLSMMSQIMIYLFFHGIQWEILKIIVICDVMGLTTPKYLLKILVDNDRWKVGSGQNWNR